MRKRLQPYSPAVTEGPDVRDAVIDLGAACLPAPSLARRCDDVSVELLDVEQFDGEVVEGIVAVVQPCEQGLRAVKGLNGSRGDDVGRSQLLMAPRSRAFTAAYMRAMNSLPSGIAPTYRSRRH